MHLAPRYESRDFRDRDQRQQTGRASGWGDHFKKGISILGTTAFIALTAYNMFVVGGWISDWYAKKRAARMGHFRRSHVKRWDFEDPFVRGGRMGNDAGSKVPHR
jgi:hypothetical protein